VAAGRRLADHVARGVEVHARRGSERRLLAEIEEGLAAVGELQGHEAAAAEVAGRGIDDCERVADRDRGIDGVAAPSQHLDAGLGRQVLRAHHHAVLRRHRRRRRRGRLARRAGDEEQQRQHEGAGRAAKRRRGHRSAKDRRRWRADFIRPRSAASGVADRTP